VNENEIAGLLHECSHGHLTRRQFIGRAVAAGLSASAAAALLASCGGAGTSETPSEPTAMDTTRPAKLFLYNWADYLAPSVQKGFERTYGIKIVQTYFDDNEAMLAKLKAGATGYDVIVPTGYMSSILAKTGLIQTLNADLLPNRKYIPPKYENPAYDPVTKGKFYTVPYMWGTTGICVRTDKTKDEITRWADLWNPKYKNMIAMMNDEREDLAAALKLLGYSLNTTDPDQIRQAADKLIEQKPLVRKYVITSVWREIAAGTPICHSWNGEVALAVNGLGAGSEKLVNFVLPEEGFTVWTDTLAIPAGAPSPYGAHLFMNYVMDPRVAVKNALFTGYLPGNVPAMAEVEKKNPVASMITPTDQDLERGEFLLDPGAATQYYSSEWQRVKSA
jgi:spermidine/putrescine transport system substrate-binding protein